MPLNSTRFKLILLGIVAALVVLALVAYAPITLEQAEPFLHWIEGLILAGIAADTHTKMGSDR